MDPRVTRTLAYYSKRDETLAGEIPLSGLGLADLQRMFRQPVDDPMYDAYPVGPAHAPDLEKALTQKLDLERYDYFVECHAEPEPARAPGHDSPSSRADLGTRR